jgi:hypothetical protein
MPLHPDQLVRDAADIARRLADKMRRIHGPDRALYFEQLADAAEARAARLHALATRRTVDDATLTALGLRIRGLRELARWIVDLRARLNAGALTGLPRIDLGYGTARLPAEIAARTMLADLDHLKALPADDAIRQARLMILLGDFGRLRLQIG